MAVSGTVMINFMCVSTILHIPPNSSQDFVTFYESVVFNRFKLVEWVTIVLLV